MKFLLSGQAFDLCMVGKGCDAGTVFIFPVLKFSAACFSFCSADIAPLILTSDGENYATVVGYSAFLHCEIFASPAADIRW